MSKLKIWQEYPSWEQAATAWDKAAQEAAKENPIKILKNIPDMIGVTPETAKNLKWKSIKWMITQDHDKKVLRGFLKHPFKYGLRLLQSFWKKKSYSRDGDFFIYGLRSVEEFQKELLKENVLLVIGFSYCHKPFECPSGRFTDACIHDAKHSVCRQCFIGKTVHTLPDENVVPLFIPTVHYVGGKIFELIDKYPEKEILFIITACELTLEMFGDWGNMVGIKGLGVRLGGRICNTMKAFELSEKGIKPGLTVVLDDTQKAILHLLQEFQKKPK